MVTVSVEDIKVLLTQENPFLSKLQSKAHAQAKSLGGLSGEPLWPLDTHMELPSFEFGSSVFHSDTDCNFFFFSPGMGSIVLRYQPNPE
jgi:hypothetical protein